jgi:translation initiation factor 1 (eIF-1/SUI1)
MDLATQLQNALSDTKESGWQSDVLCKKCGYNRSECRCEEPIQPLAPADHRLRLKREKRKGKAVVLIGPFALEEKQLQMLSKTLKTSLARGGGIEGVWLLFQGACEGPLSEALKKLGYGFKR